MDDVIAVDFRHPLHVLQFGEFPVCSGTDEDTIFTRICKINKPRIFSYTIRGGINKPYTITAKTRWRCFFEINGTDIEPISYILICGLPRGKTAALENSNSLLANGRT